MAHYSYATLTQAEADLAGRLYDSGQSQWVGPELAVYITEALRTWNALTSFWRAAFPFALTEGQWWYDLTVQTGTLRPVTVTDADLIQEIEYHLLEPLTDTYPLQWTGSGQFNLQQILGAITRRQNEVLGSTGCTITRQLVDAPIVRAGIVLADTTIDIRRVAWIPVFGQGWAPVILRQSDTWAKRAFDGGYTTAAVYPPSCWMQTTEPPPQFDVDRVPPVGGQYDVLTVNSGANASLDEPSLLSVPDDWSWLVKWGALSELLGRESNAKDSVRAEYCQRRYAEGLKFLSGASSVLDLQVNGIPLFVDAVTNGDNFNSEWQALPEGPPDSCYTTGLNLVGFPAPDAPEAGAYSALITVVQNAPVPTSRGSYIQVARSDYDVILDYAQHLAVFKQGGAEFLATIPLYQNFLDRANLYNAKLKAMGQFQWAEYDISQTDNERNPRVVEVAG